MSRRRWFATGTLLVAATLTAPTAASSAPTASSRHPSGDGATVEVRIGDNYFRPATLRIRAGTTVRWTNTGRNEHDIVPNKGQRFGVDELTPDQTYRHRFGKAGRYPYYCSFHGAPGAGQHATIRVVEDATERETKRREDDG